MNSKQLIIKVHFKLMQWLDGNGNLTSFFIKHLPLVYAHLSFLHVRIKDEEYQLVKLVGNTSKTAIDIGAFYGAYTYKMQQFFKTVICIEPTPLSFRLLKSVFGKNKKVQLLNNAVSNKAGIITLNIPVGRPALAYVNKKQNELKDLKTIQHHIQTITIDSLNLQEVGFIKMDIEGHELQALQGMTKTLKKYHPTLLMEIEDRHNANSTTIIELLKGLGYKSYLYKNGCLEPVAIITNNESASYNKLIDYDNNFVFKV